jgi:hypothetical protein
MKIKKKLDSLHKYECWFKNFSDQIFNTLGFLKKYLKEKHGRYLCKVCVEFKTALLMK